MHGVRMDRSQPPLEHNGVRINLAVWDPQAKEPASLENPLLFYSAWSYQATAQLSLTPAFRSLQEGGAKPSE